MAEPKLRKVQIIIGPPGESLVAAPETVPTDTIKISAGNAILGDDITVKPFAGGSSGSFAPLASGMGFVSRWDLLSLDVSGATPVLSIDAGTPSGVLENFEDSIPTIPTDKIALAAILITEVTPTPVVLDAARIVDIRGFFHRSLHPLPAQDLRGVYVRLVKASGGDFTNVGAAIDDFETSVERAAIIFIEGALVDAGAAGSHITTKSNIRFVGISQSSGAKSEIEFGTGVSAELRFDETVRVKFENLKIIRNVGTSTGRIRIGTGANRDNELVFKDCEFEDNATAAGTSLIDVNAPLTGQVTRVVLDGTFAVFVSGANMSLFDFSNVGSGRFEFVARNHSYVGNTRTTGSNHAEDIMSRAGGTPDLSITIESHSFFGFNAISSAGWADPGIIDLFLDGTATVIGAQLHNDIRNKAIIGDNMWNPEWLEVANGGRAPTSVGSGVGNNFLGYIVKAVGSIVRFPPGVHGFDFLTTTSLRVGFTAPNGTPGITPVGRTYIGSGTDETYIVLDVSSHQVGEPNFFIAEGSTNVKIKDLTLRVNNTDAAFGGALFEAQIDTDAALLENVVLQYNSAFNVTGSAFLLGRATGKPENVPKYGLVLKNVVFHNIGIGTVTNGFQITGTVQKSLLDGCHVLGPVSGECYLLDNCEVVACTLILSEASSSGAIGFNGNDDNRFSACKAVTNAITAGKLFEGFRLANRNQMVNCIVDGDKVSARRIEHGVVVTGTLNIVHGSFFRRMNAAAVEVQAAANFNIVNDNMFEDNLVKSVDEITGSNNLNVNGNVSSGGTGYTTTGAQSISGDNI